MIQDKAESIEVGSQAVHASQVQPVASKPARLDSLDVFRGLTLVAMVFVNSHGHRKYMYPGIDHSHWSGWGLADLAFPFFIFIVGVAIPYSLQSRMARGEKGLWIHVFKRSAILFVLGVLMGLVPDFNFGGIRYLGVLQRIAICYLGASLLYMTVKPKGLAIISAAILILYFVLLKYVPVPGVGAGVLDQPEGNWAQYIDYKLMAGHMQFPKLETKGLLSTLPALVTALIGVLTGQYLRSSDDPLKKTANMYLYGTFGVCLGWVWGISFVVSQAIWTSSYVLLMAGMSLIALASCYYLVDIRKSRWWTPPLMAFGTNAIAVWIGSMFSRQAMEMIFVTGHSGKSVDLKTYLYECLAAWVGPHNGSLLFAVLFILFWMAIMGMLYRKGIVIKI